MKSFLSQFDSQHPLYRSLEKIYNLESLDYFQTGILYFDTSIIDESTKKDLINLAEKFHSLQLMSKEL